MINLALTYNGNSYSPAEIADKLTIRAINLDDYEGNPDELILSVYGDMALCVCADLADDGHDTPYVPKSALPLMRMTESEAIDLAMEHMAAQSVPVLTDLGEIDCERGADGMEEFFARIIEPGSDRSGYQTTGLTLIGGLSVSQWGALGIFHPGVMERCAEMLGGDYYVVFLGRELCLLHPAGLVDAIGLRDQLGQVNQAYGDEVLSRTVYLYDSKLQVLIPYTPGVADGYSM